jgi:hypothetical protein
LLKLALIFLVSAACGAQTAPLEPNRTLPHHSPNQLLQRYWIAAQGHPYYRQFDRNRVMIANVPGNTCFKLRKYIFEPVEPTAKNGMLPLGDTMVQVGETDCTYANKVWPKSADRMNPPPSQFGVQSTVLRQK